MGTTDEERNFSPEQLGEALDHLEQRALGHQRVPIVPLAMARAIQDHAAVESRRLSKVMAQATAQRRQVLLAMTEPSFPAELYIAKIRAQHQYRRVARDLERAKRRSGIAFRALEKAVQQNGAGGFSRVDELVAETRRSLAGPGAGPDLVAEESTDLHDGQLFLLDQLLQEDTGFAEAGEKVGRGAEV